MASVDSRSRLLRFALVAGAVTVLALGAVWLVARSDGGIASGGPLACPECHTGASMPMSVGELGTYGAANLDNHGKEPAVLDRVELVDRTRGLRILGPLVFRSGDRPGGGIGLIRQFPPPGLKGALHPLHGYRVLPYRSFDDDVALLVGVSPLREGKLSYRKLKLYYHVGEERYVATFDMGVRVCAPRSVQLARCPTPLDDQE